MRITVSCGWCHAEVEINKSRGEVFCGGCGHNAAVARMCCDCDKCQALRRRSEAIARGQAIALFEQRSREL